MKKYIVTEEQLRKLNVLVFIEGKPHIEIGMDKEPIFELGDR
jgi:hypothetical protein